MANIRVDIGHEIIDGQPVTFVAPCDCTAIDGLKVYYPGGSKVFVFKDAHGNVLTGIGNLFAAGAYVKAILDVTGGSAYIQNADTNAYLEAALAGKAPAGYGLGESDLKAIDSNDANDAIRNGKYNVYTTTAHSPGVNGAMEVTCRTYGFAHQKVTEDNTGYMFYRRQIAGEWEPWEWVNPRTVPGVEYRTTERYNGKPVFTQLIDCGQSADKKTISYLNSEQIMAVIRHAGRISGSVAPQANNNDWTNAWSLQFLVSTTSASLRCGTSLVGKLTYLQIWYIKGTEFE